MKKIINYLFRSIASPPPVQLILNDDGYYIVKAYNQYLPSTLTRDKEEAEASFKYILECEQGKHPRKEIVIKEAIIV